MRKRICKQMRCSELAEGMSERDTEINALESIFGELISIHKRDDDNVILEMNVRPVDDGIHSPPTIRVTIEVASLYPSVPPKVRLWQPRGVDEKHVAELNNQLTSFLNDNRDMPVLFDLFGQVQAYLESVHTGPSGLCPICLTDFSSQLASTRTHCDHYVHQSCFVSYIDFSRCEIQRQLGEWPSDMQNKVDQALRCPMCREVLDEEDCHKAEKCKEVDRWVDPNEYYFDWDLWRKTQSKWAVIMTKQRANGGLIDVDAESHRFLVTDDTVLESRVTNLEPIERDMGEDTMSSASNSTYRQPRGGARRHWPGRNVVRESQISETGEREDLCNRFNSTVRVGGNKPKYGYRRDYYRKATGTRHPPRRIDTVRPPPGLEHGSSQQAPCDL